MERQTAGGTEPADARAADRKGTDANEDPPRAQVGFDAADLRDTIDSPGFALIQARLVEARERTITALVSANTWDECRYLQGQIHAFNCAIAIPKILTDERRAAHNKENRT